MHVSPFMTSEKAGTTKRRAIVDLSYPQHLSVNAGVSTNKYLGTYIQFKYPSVDHIVQAVKEVGPAALIFKVDISLQAFRHLRIDPGDLDLLRLKHQNSFLDGSLPFRFRHGSLFFQCCSQSIKYIMASLGFTRLYPYIDDLIYVGLPYEIHHAYSVYLISHPLLLLFV